MRHKFNTLNYLARNNYVCRKYTTNSKCSVTRRVENGSNVLLFRCTNFDIFRCYAVDSFGERKYKFESGPSLKDFITRAAPEEIPVEQSEKIPYVNDSSFQGIGRKVYFDVYGCQMNVSDTEIIWSILKNVGYSKTEAIKDADVILLITCAIREGAESKIWDKISYLKHLKETCLHRERRHVKIGLLGCMAERLKHKILEKDKSVDLIAGPDSYKDLPRLLALTENNQTAVNVLLSLDETYADIMPVRLNQDSVSAFVSIMRGCDNMCTYCIVPFTRGRERSRPIPSILEEVKILSHQGVKEVTLLGQNVNSYRDTSSVDYFGGLPSTEETHLSKGFRTVYKSKKGGLRFADLLDHVSRIDPEMRIRFTSPHPKDFPDEVLQLIQERSNICRSLHLPAQSGSSVVLERMRRGYTREAYMELVQNARKHIPGVSLSSDFICGFCGETEEQFEETLSLIEEVKYNMAYLFAYSMREKTTAHRRLVDDIPTEVKNFRVKRMVDVYRREVRKLNDLKIGVTELVLVEGPSKRSSDYLSGRNDGNTKVILPVGTIPESRDPQIVRPIKAGDYVAVLINAATSQVLKGIPLYHTTISDFYSDNNNTHLMYMEHLHNS